MFFFSWIKLVQYFHLSIIKAKLLLNYTRIINICREKTMFRQSLIQNRMNAGILIELSPLTPVPLGDESGNKVIPVSSLSNLCKFQFWFFDVCGDEITTNSELMSQRINKMWHYLFNLKLWKRYFCYEIINNNNNKKTWSNIHFFKIFL